jgi:hypothetical protein
VKDGIAQRHIFGKDNLTASYEAVTPAKAGVQRALDTSKTLDSGVRRNDERDAFRTYYRFVNFE